MKFQFARQLKNMVNDLQNDREQVLSHKHPAQPLIEQLVRLAVSLLACTAQVACHADHDPEDHELLNMILHEPYVELF